MNPDNSISIIIPVYNAAQTIARCLTAVFDATLRPFQVIVVDDGSTDRSAEIAATFPCQVVRLARNTGAAAARNRGAALARGANLFFLDADIVSPVDAVERIIRIFESRPEVSAVFGSYQKNTVPTNFISVYKNLSHHYTHQVSAGEAATFCAGFGAVRRQVFTAFGGFDETQRALEDIEFGYRLHRAGHRIRLDKTLQFTHCKTYSLASLMTSDVWNRAVPWTQLMLRQHVFRNDLNTKTNNVASVGLAFALLGAPIWIWVTPFAALIMLAVVVGFLCLNCGFFRFVYRERGAGFLGKAILLNWFSYIYSGIGLGLGVLIYIQRRWVARRAASSE
jgi:glycosyltransferase involved in cell wall biosynthesis